MNKMRSDEAYDAAMNVIQAQLQALPVAMAAAIAMPSDARVPRQDWESLLQSRRQRRPQDTGSVGNIVAGAAKDKPEVEVCAAQPFPANRAQQTDYLRIVVGNALLAVGMFLKDHDMAEMRTPEIQFLDHVCEAILNGNRFKLDSGYMPIASFDGLVIEAGLDGTLLFDQQDQQGFMGWGDAVALLQWLLRYLEGSQRFVSGGDAG